MLHCCHPGLPTTALSPCRGTTSASHPWFDALTQSFHRLNLSEIRNPKPLYGRAVAAFTRRQITAAARLFKECLYGFCSAPATRSVCLFRSPPGAWLIKASRAAQRRCAGPAAPRASRPPAPHGARTAAGWPPPSRAGCWGRAGRLRSRGKERVTAGRGGPSRPVPSVSGRLRPHLRRR